MLRRFVFGVERVNDVADYFVDLGFEPSTDGGGRKSPK